MIDFYQTITFYSFLSQNNNNFYITNSLKYVQCLILPIIFWGGVTKPESFFSINLNSVNKITYELIYIYICLIYISNCFLFLTKNC